MKLLRTTMNKTDGLVIGFVVVVVLFLVDDDDVKKDGIPMVW